MLKLGVVGNPGAWSTERLADAVETRTGERLVIDLARVSLDLARGKVLHGGLDLLSLDGLVIKKIGRSYAPRHLDRLELLRFVQERGVPVFSDPQSIMGVIDRLSCTVRLQLAGIPMPPTVITEDPEEAVAAVERFGQAVFKPLFSTKARGMEIIEAGTDAPERVQTYQEAGHRVMYIQQLVELPGQDLGIAFLGGEYLGTYARVANKDSWNTTARAGGHYEPYHPSDEVIELARRAAQVFDLDFTSVDVAECADGPIVFEISAFGAFRGLIEAAGIDVAQRYVDYVLERIRGD